MITDLPRRQDLPSRALGLELVRLREPVQVRVQLPELAQVQLWEPVSVRPREPRWARVVRQALQFHQGLGLQRCHSRVREREPECWRVPRHRGAARAALQWEWTRQE